MARRKSRLNMWIGLALGSFIAITFMGHKVADAIGVHTTDVIRGGASSGTLSCRQLERLWVAAGGNPSAAFMAAEIARAESGGRQYARDPASGTYASGTADYGYWQINSVNGGSDASYDPMKNARQAVAISRNGTYWWPWITWRHGAENGQC